MFYLSTPYVNRHPQIMPPGRIQSAIDTIQKRIRLIEYQHIKNRAPECRKIPSSSIAAQVNTYNNQTIQLQVTFHTNQSPEFTILPIDLPENRWKPLDIPWSSNSFAWECPVYRLIAITWADIAEKLGHSNNESKGMRNFQTKLRTPKSGIGSQKQKAEDSKPIAICPQSDTPISRSPPGISRLFVCYGSTIPILRPNTQPSSSHCHVAKR